MEILNDGSLMPFGKYKGRKMEDVPARYLVWLYENGKCNGPVRLYISVNMETLRLEIKQGLGEE